MRKKICIFCETWESGGIESFINAILLNGDRNAIEVDIVVSKLKDSVFTAGLKQAGVHFYSLSGRTSQILLNAMLFRSILKKRQYDIVHFNIYQGVSMIYAQIAATYKVPVRIVHSHNADLRKSLSKPMKMLLHRAARQIFSRYATDFWACSSSAAEFMFPRKSVLEKVLLIPNGINTSEFAFDAVERDEVRIQMGIEDKFVIGNVGRLCYQKNQTFLIDVLSELIKIESNSILLLVGDGAERVHLEEKIYSCGLQSHVIFYGNTPKPEKLYWAMDVFAFPSLFEGFGIVSVEAQASGLPVICSEFVPSETYLTSAVKMVPIQEGSNRWAQELLRTAKIRQERYDAALKVKAAGFDIKDVAKQVGAYYCNHT